MPIPPKTFLLPEEAVQDLGRARGASGLAILVLVVVLLWHIEVLFPDISGLKDPKPSL